MVFEKRYTEGVGGLGTTGRLKGPQVRKKSGEVCLSAVRPFLRQQLAGIRGLSR